MVKVFFSALLVMCSAAAMAQPTTREELEKQKAQLKKELEQTERMLNENKSKSKENYVQWKLVNDKVNLQDRIIDNINRDINILDNNLYNTQRDINRYNRLLDTLKQEYAKSMVYAYKNRSNYDFLNFIFSAASFNDAIKRVTYLKSYRDYREMQGQNILRTQELRKKRVEELTGTKLQKNQVLQSKDKEMAVLEKEKIEKDRIMNELKKQGKELNGRIAATQKQLKKVDNAIAATIKRAIEEAKKAAIAAAKVKKANTPANTSAPNTTGKVTSPGAKTTTSGKAPAAVVKAPESVLLNEANTALNKEFVKNRGALPWPVDKGYPMMHFGRNQLPSGSWIDINCVSISTEIGSQVKAVFEGTVSSIIYVEDMQVVTIQHGKYFSTYSNITNVSVKKDQIVERGQTIGRAAANLEGVGAVDFYISDERSNQNPESWLKRR